MPAPRRQGRREFIHISSSTNERNFVQKFEKLLQLDQDFVIDQVANYNDVDIKVERENEMERQRRQQDFYADQRNLDPPHFKLQLRENPQHLKEFRQVILTSADSKDEYHGSIVWIKKQWIYFYLNSVADESANELKSFPGGRSYNVAFLPLTVTWDRCRAALVKFASNQRLKAALFPLPRAQLSRPLISASDLRSSEGGRATLLGRTLNDSQRATVIGSLESRCRPAPFIVFGPPGTGKTATLAETVLQVHVQRPLARTLVCGTSNDSTDILARALKLSGVVREGKLVRLTAAYRLKQKVPADLRDVSKEFRELEELHQRGVRHSIYMSTCSQAATLIKLHLKFDYVFVDEAGSASEPEALIPLTLMKPDGAAVLAGDPRQLGPISENKLAEHLGLGISMLERLYRRQVYGGDRPMRGGNFDSNYITMLSICYRCDERIMKVNNEMFYFNELKFANETPDEWLVKMNSRNPLMFIPVSEGVQKKPQGSSSLRNKEEAKVVLKCVKKLYKFGLRDYQLGIVTPYRAQADWLVEKFRNYCLRRCKIDTVEKFQGDEREVMIVTTVRTPTDWPPSKFFTNPRRFNVAVSRAKWMVILVGHPDLLADDDCWGRYIDCAQRIAA